MEENNVKNWFKLSDVKLVGKSDRFNEQKCRDNLNLMSTLDLQSDYCYELSYINVEAKLQFSGTLDTPRGVENVCYDYFIKTTLEGIIKEAKITIYEQTFKGLAEAVTIRFSSGSIISKIVFGDIELAFKELKERAFELVDKYNENAKKVNAEIEKLKKEKEDSKDE